MILMVNKCFINVFLNFKGNNDGERYDKVNKKIPFKYVRPVEDWLQEKGNLTQTFALCLLTVLMLCCLKWEYQIFIFLPFDDVIMNSGMLTLTIFFLLSLQANVLGVKQKNNWCELVTAKYKVSLWILVLILNFLHSSNLIICPKLFINSTWQVGKLKLIFAKHFWNSEAPKSHSAL